MNTTTSAYTSTVRTAPPEPGEPVRIGVLVPISRFLWEGADPRDLIDFGRRAEALGLDSLWVNDSLVSPRIEALTMLSALAAATERVTLGTAALLPVLRRPVQAANALASIDLLSHGRLVAAVGAGFPGRLGRPMYEVSEVPWPRRFTRLDETVALWRQLWTPGSPRSFHSELLRFDDLPEPTLPHRPGGPRIWLGGATPRALERTGRLYDGWLPYPPEARDYASGIEHARKAAADAGRDPGELTAALFATVRLAEDRAAGEDVLRRFTLASYGMPLEQVSTIQAVNTGTPQQIAAWLQRYVDAGARHLVIRIAALGLDDHRDQLARIAQADFAAVLGQT